MRFAKERYPKLRRIEERLDYLDHRIRRTVQMCIDFVPDAISDFERILDLDFSFGNFSEKTVHDLEAAKIYLTYVRSFAASAKEPVRIAPDAGVWQGLGMSEPEGAAEPDTPPDSALSESPKVAKPVRRKKNRKLVELRRFVKQMLDKEETHSDICKQLGDSPRPPRVEWRHLSWPTAYRDQRHGPAVRKWISSTRTD